MRHMWTIGMASFRNFNEDSCQLLRFHVDKIGGQNLLLSDNVREQFVAVNIVIKHLRIKSILCISKVYITYNGYSFKIFSSDFSPYVMDLQTAFVLTPSALAMSDLLISRK